MHSKMLWSALALVAVLGLTATASGKVHSLITGKDIAPYSITSRHMVNGTLQAHDLSAGLIASLQGKSGATGAKGDAGAKGDTGAAGARGETGAAGAKGETGATGAKGETGATGARGETGTAGAKGDPGATGAKGDPGAIGAKGDAGAAGARGDKGDKGDQGPPGLSNVQTDGPYPGATQLSGYPGGRANSTAEWVGDKGVTLQQSWVMCGCGKVAVGGGFSRADEGAVAEHGLQIVTSSPAQIVNGKVVSLTGTDGFTPTPGDPAGSFKPNGWLVEGFNNNDGGQLIVRPWVVCADVK
jgi:hypothetical protein